MNFDPLTPRKDRSLWIFIAGFAAAALLTLGAAVGTSLLHQQPDRQKADQAPVVQR